MHLFLLVIVSPSQASCARYVPYRIFAISSRRVSGPQPLTLNSVELPTVRVSRSSALNDELQSTLSFLFICRDSTNAISVFVATLWQTSCTSSPSALSRVLKRESWADRFEIYDYLLAINFVHCITLVILLRVTYIVVCT